MNILVKIIVVCLVSLSFVFNASAQEDSSEFKFSVSQVQLAHEQISTLRNSILIVRLNENTKQINNYRRVGQHKIADRIEKLTNEQNLNFMSAMVLEFDFCKIYFSKMSETAGKDFGDSILVLDTTFLHPYYIKINKDSLFFLDYGVLFAEQLVSDGMVKNPYNKEEASVIKATDALVLKNNKGQQLFSPMPYFSSIFSKSFHKKVVKLNEDLFSYFNKVAKKEKRNIYLYSAPTIHNKQIISEWLLSIQKQLRSINIKNPKFTPQY